MTRNKTNAKYFEWMCKLSGVEEQYFDLLNHLHNIDFTYIIDNDGNRSGDGIDLRYRFGYEKDYAQPVISTYLDDKSCSVLEMLIALSMRCEENIMDNPDVGDRTGYWFWTMIESLGLDEMCNDNYDEEYIDRVIQRFLEREYGRDGTGGLFTIVNCNRDLRNVEIWYQMCWYLDSIIGEEN